MELEEEASKFSVSHFCFAVVLSFRAILYPNSGPFPNVLLNAPVLYPVFVMRLSESNARNPIYPLMFGNPAALVVPLVLLPCTNLSVKLGRLNVVESFPAP